jgi:malate dehydrogenase (oxaloacetate-decarboxylating)
VFRGALDARAPAINDEMKLAAAQGIASVVGDDESMRITSFRAS